MMALGEDHLLTGFRPSNERNGSIDSEIQIWHLPWSRRMEAGLTLSPKAEKADIIVPNCFLLSFTFSSDHLICGCRTKVVVVAMPKFGVFTSGDVEAVAGTVFRAVDLPPLVAATSLHSLGHSFAVGTSDGSVCLEAFGSINLKDTSKCFYPGGNINTLQASVDGLVLYSGSSNGRICRVWVEKMTSGSCFSQPGAMPSNNVLSLALQGTDRIASSSANGILAVWNLNLTVLTNEEPLLIFQTSSYQMRMVISPDFTYYYTSGTAGALRAYTVDSIPAAVRRMHQSPICQPPGVCSTDWVRYHSRKAVAMPQFLETLPLQWLSLQGAKIDIMGPQPPISLRNVNLSGSWLADWRSMHSGWWWIPSAIDVRSVSGFISIPILHGQAMRLVTDQNCIEAAAVKEHSLHKNFCILRGFQKEGELCAENFNSHDMTREALAANVEGTPLPILTRILVDPGDFQAWLCDCPSGKYGLNE
eukprot:symbB.v1.2.011576.t1/scaffold781.1/size163279/10